MESVSVEVLECRTTEISLISILLEIRKLSGNLWRRTGLEAIGQNHYNI